MSLDDLKLKIKEDISISSVIGNYLSIKRSGTSLVSLCPFHSDTKPSMHINDSRKIYKCFACGAAGDAITFVMKYRNLDFIDALKEICNKQGLHFESYQDEKKTNPKFEMGKKILSKTAQLYRKMATGMGNSPYTEFIKNRGLNEDTAKTYSLGFAPNKNALFDYLSSIPNEKERSFAISVALELSLVKKNPTNENNLYDTFRDRIIFPIWDNIGQVIGFTSRSIRAEQLPKYMNSKDSFLFNKGNILYGFHLAKNNIREKDFVILVEGNMDQIALSQFGFQNTVAVMGVALGPNSLERLTTLTKNIYLALDSDAAGFNAMKRMNAQLAEKGIVARFIDFSPEKDPDEFLQAHGPIKLQEKIENATAAFDIILERIIPDLIPELVDKKLELLYKAFEILSPLKKELSATERLIKFSKRIGLNSNSEQIFDKYESYLNGTEKPKRFQVPLDAPMIQEEIHLNNGEEIHIENSILSPKPNFRPLTKAERLIVQELVQLPALLSMANITELLDLVSSPEVKIYIEKVRRLFMEVDENEYSALALNLADEETFPMDLKEAVADALFKYRAKELDLKNRNRLIHDLKIKLQAEQLIKKKELLKETQSSMETQGEINTLLSEIITIEKSLNALKKIKPEKTN